MSRNAFTLALLGAAHSLNHSLFLVIPPLLSNISSDLNASFQTLGLIVTITFLIYGAGALIGGPLSDRLGGLKVAQLSIGLAGVSTFAFIFAGDLIALGTGLFLMAFWASFYHPTSNTLISKAFPDNMGEAMGVHGAGGSVGQIFTPTVGYLLGVLVNWRFAFVFFGAISIVTAVAIGRIPYSEEVAIGERSEKASLRELLRHRSLWMILLFNVFVGLFYRGVDLFFPTFLSRNRGISGELAAMLNSAVLFFGVIGQYTCGRASDRYGSIRVVIVTSVGMFASMFFLQLIPIEVLGIGFFIAVYGMSYYGQQPAMTALVSRIAPRNLVGTAYGMMFFASFGLGSFSAAIAGYLADSFGLEIAFWTMAVFALATLAISMALLKIQKSTAAIR
jgi:MFS family permease